MAQGRRQATRLIAVQQAALVWSPIEYGWQAEEFVQRGVMPKQISQSQQITPEVQAKIDEYRQTGVLTVEPPKNEGE